MHSSLKRLSFLLLLLFAGSSALAARAPVMEPQVETVIRSHEGAVGALAIDVLEYLYIADFQETLWRYDIQNDQVEPFAKGFYGASGVYLDRDGSILQANYFGHSIDKVSRTGVVTRFVTEGLSGPVGMVKNADGDLLVCNCNDQTIKKVSPSGEVSEFATSPLFRCPNGITMDSSGNYYVVSFSGSKIVKITPEGETSEFADSGGKGLGHIVYVNDTFYASSFNDNKIFKITADGSLSLFAGTGERGQKDGAALKAKFSNPNGIVANATGKSLYVNDYIGDTAALGMAKSPYSVRRIDIPNLSAILKHELDNNSIASAQQAYETFLGVEEPDRGNVNQLNQLGWSYMLQNKFAEAVTVFELNTKTFPESWLVYSSLGGGYKALGENDKAIVALKRSLELNPDNKVAKGRLLELGASEN